eukprot:c14402_g1_i2 orf=206-1228(-)
MGRERSVQTPSDSYFLECRKDTQCKCSMCEASIHATLDLRPSNHLFSPITNTVESAIREHSVTSKLRGKENKWLNWDDCETVATPPQKENGRTARAQSLPRDADSCRQGTPKRTAPWNRRVLQLLFLIFLAEFLGPCCMSCLYRPALTSECVKRTAESSVTRNKLVDRLDYVRYKLSSSVLSGSVSNCTGANSLWTLVEHGLLVHSSCNIYSSAAESVRLWGYPTKSSGVLGRSIVDRYFTVLSGRVLEWREGNMEYVIHPEGSSWTLSKWGASVILLDGNTWILEYKRAVFSEGLGSLSGLYLVKQGVHLASLHLKKSFGTIFFNPSCAILWNSDSPPT